jgi:hypothetical protein
VADFCFCKWTQDQLLQIPVVIKEAAKAGPELGFRAGASVSTIVVRSGLNGGSLVEEKQRKRRTADGRLTDQASGVLQLFDVRGVDTWHDNENRSLDSLQDGVIKRKVLRHTGEPVTSEQQRRLGHESE